MLEKAEGDEQLPGRLTVLRRRGRVGDRLGPNAVQRQSSAFESEGTNLSPKTIMAKGEVLYVVHIAGSSHTPRSSAARPR